MSIGIRTPIGPSPLPEIPRLKPGDRLARDEFERRFEATPGLTRAELIEGVVHMPPAVRAENHGGPHADLVACLVVYRAETPGLKVYDNASIRLDMDNEPQPDIAMLIDPALGGQAHISDDDYIEGAPELVAEISASTAGIDLDAKFRVYGRNGVREYLVWRISDSAIDQFLLKAGKFERTVRSSDGVVRSEQFPGLWLDTSALIRRDVAAVLRLLQQRLASPEHAAFVAQLQSRAAAKPGPATQST